MGTCQQDLTWLGCRSCWKNIKYYCTNVRFFLSCKPLSHVHLFPQSIAEHECIHPTQEWVVGQWSISRDKCLISCDRSLEDMNSLTNHATLPKIGLQNTLQYVWQVSFHKIAIPWWETSTSIATCHVDRNVLSCTFLIIINMTHMKVLTHVHQRIFEG